MLSSRNIQNAFSTTRAESGVAKQARDQPLGERDVDASSASPVKRSRPSHFRSRSYLSNSSPTDPKPRNSTTMPTGATFDASDKAEGPHLSNGIDGSHHSDVMGREKDKDGNESGASSAASLLPRLHLHSAHHKKRKSQDLRHTTPDTPSPQSSSARTNSQLHLQHLGLNLPVQLKRAHSHRHTKSEVPKGHAYHETNSSGLQASGDGGGGKTGMLARVTSNLSSKSGADSKHLHMHKPHHQHSSSDFRRAWNNAAVAGHPYIPGPIIRPDLRRRATSDPKSPSFGPNHAQYHYQNLSRPDQQLSKPMSELEILLYKAEKTRKEAETNVTEADIQKLSIQLAESNVELQSQLGDANRSAQALIRRLDDAHESLTHTASSLIDTISSFQNLCAQSDQLIKNFESRANELDNDMRKTLEKHKNALFEERGTKITALEKRGQRANERAEEMSRRLENCRTMVRNFTEREQTKRRAWKGVLIGSVWGVSIVTFGILLGLALWWWKSHGYLEGHRVVLQRLEGEHGATEALRNVPNDVKIVLEDIARRHNASASTHSHISDTERARSSISIEAGTSHDKKLEKLFRKLEL